MLTPVQWSSQDASDGKGSAGKTLQVGPLGVVPGAGSPHDAGFSSLLFPELALPGFSCPASLHPLEFFMPP